MAFQRPNDRPADIVADAIEHFDSHYDQTQVISARRAVNKARLEARPRLPRTRENVFSALHMAKESRSLKGADMIKQLDSGSGIAMFYSDRNLDLLKDYSKQIF